MHPSAQVKNSRDAPSLSPVARPPGASHPRHRPPPHDCSSLPKALSPTPRGGDSQIGGDARAGGANPRGGPAARRRVHLRGGRVARHAADGDQVRVGGDPGQRGGARRLCPHVRVPPLLPPDPRRQGNPSLPTRLVLHTDRFYYIDR